MASSVKERLHELVDRLDENATWDDFVYLIYIRDKIARGRAGRARSLEDVRRSFGLEP